MEAPFRVFPEFAEQNGGTALRSRWTGVRFGRQQASQAGRNAARSGMHWRAGVAAAVKVTRRTWALGHQAGGQEGCPLDRSVDAVVETAARHRDAAVSCGVRGRLRPRLRPELRASRRRACPPGGSCWTAIPDGHRPSSVRPNGRSPGLPCRPSATACAHRRSSGR